MNLFLLRHGIAAELRRGGSDAARRLTAEGERKTRMVARSMKAMKVVPERIFSSPYARARETAEIIAEVLHLEKSLELTDSLAPGGDPRDLIALIREKCERPTDILLVGHEPYLSGLAGFLISGRHGPSLIFKKSGLCKLALEGPLTHGRCAALEWLLTPKQMVRMA